MPALGGFPGLKSGEGDEQGSFPPPASALQIRALTEVLQSLCCSRWDRKGWKLFPC